MAKTPKPEISDDNFEPDEAAVAQPLPTEQIPFEPSPVSASAAASGGATGLEGTGRGGPTTKRSSFARRHPLGVGIAVGAAAVIIASGLTAWGVGAAVTSSLTSHTAQLAPAPGASALPGAGAGVGTAAGGRVAFRATIQSISDTGWTILTKKGQTVTVTFDASTRFGTKRTAESATDFAVGDSVLIVAIKSNSSTATSGTATTGAVTATRIVNLGEISPNPNPTSNTTT